MRSLMKLDDLLRFARARAKHVALGASFLCAFFFASRWSQAAQEATEEATEQDLVVEEEATR